MGRHTRGPIRGVIGETCTLLKDRLELAAKVVKKLGIPEPLKKRRGRGRKRMYSMRKLIAAVIAKGTLSFVDLARELKDNGYNAGISSRASPSKGICSTFSLPESYLNCALRMLDGMTAELYSKFGEKLNIFAVIIQL